MRLQLQGRYIAFFRKNVGWIVYDKHKGENIEIFANSAQGKRQAEELAEERNKQAEARNRQELEVKLEKLRRKH